MNAKENTKTYYYINNSEKKLFYFIRHFLPFLSRIFFIEMGVYNETCFNSVISILSGIQPKVPYIASRCLKWKPLKHGANWIYEDLDLSATDSLWTGGDQYIVFLSLPLHLPFAPSLFFIADILQVQALYVQHFALWTSQALSDENETKVDMTASL